MALTSFGEILKTASSTIGRFNVDGFLVLHVKERIESYAQIVGTIPTNLDQKDVDLMLVDSLSFNPTWELLERRTNHDYQQHKNSYQKLKRVSNETAKRIVA
jgi:hypothetical protein